ncbi:MAG: right-handed parallel beta-helix repeat-containing protein [Candidatus Nitrosocosmicus sp.]
MIIIFSNYCKYLQNNIVIVLPLIFLFVSIFITNIPHIFATSSTDSVSIGDQTIYTGASSSASTVTGTNDLATSVNPACGQVIRGNVKLVSNLICNTDGLIVGTGDIKIDLNGFSIMGPGKNSNKVGIMVGGQTNVNIIGYGSISGFQSGIYVAGSKGIKTENLNLNNNKIAVYITGTSSANINGNMLNNNTIGIASHSNNQTTIKYNLLNENDLSGITFINSADSIINGNNIINSTNGIFLDAQSSQNKVDFNNVFNNVLDMNNANNLPLNINNNSFTNNNCLTSLPSGLCIGR